jgi:hypothetical protein
MLVPTTILKNSFGSRRLRKEKCSPLGIWDNKKLPVCNCNSKSTCYIHTKPDHSCPILGIQPSKAPNPYHIVSYLISRLYLYDSDRDIESKWERQKKIYPFFFSSHSQVFRGKRRLTRLSPAATLTQSVSHFYLLDINLLYKKLFVSILFILMLAHTVQFTWLNINVNS